MPNITYNYCGICGHVPHDGDGPNYAPLRWWDPDDGWKVGALCTGCIDDYLHVKPAEDDYAFDRTNGVMDECDTDEDPTEVFD